MTTTTTTTTNESNQPPQLPSDNLTKAIIRRKVWQHLEKYRLVNFPRPVFGRIPNFKTTEQATLKLLEFDAFVNAKSIEVNPDKPLEFARLLTLQKCKVLYVPSPQLKQSCFMKQLTVDGEKSKNFLRQLVNRKGVENYGKSMEFDQQLRIDLIIVGSVACSLNGYRIGKGKGYADLEFGILKEMTTVNDQTIIITIVHDSQVFENLPDHLFDKHDVPLDYILTPTRLIKIVEKLPKPSGIYWDLLTRKQIDFMPILQKVYEIHKTEGRSLDLKQTDRNQSSRNELSLHISNIDRTIQLRQFKDALIQNGIKPNYINWYGYRGYCYLHYLKSNHKQLNDNNCNRIDGSFAIDNVVEILKKLQLTRNSHRNLQVKVMEPITRIETTDVTSV